MSNNAIKPGVGHLDNFISKLYIKTLPFWKSLNVTPNILTTFGFISSLLAVYFFYTNNLLSIPFLLLRMYFDYVDGMFARKYNYESNFGDYYDHITDTIFFILYVFVMWKSLSGKKRKLCLALLVIFTLLSVINVGCSEKECGEKCKNGNAVELPKKMCFSPEFFKYTDNSVLYIVMTIIILIRYKYGKKHPKLTFNKIKKLFKKSK